MGISMEKKPPATMLLYVYVLLGRVGVGFLELLFYVGFVLWGVLG